MRIKLLTQIEDAKPNLSLRNLDSKSRTTQVNTALQRDSTVSLFDGLILLKTLKLAYNRMHTLGLGSMAGRVGSGGMFSLTELDMSNNQVAYLPAEVIRLSIYFCFIINYYYFFNCRLGWPIATADSFEP
jgi:hypothetical protein